MNIFLDEVVEFEFKEVVIKFKVIGCDFFSVGDFVEGFGCEDIVFCDFVCGVYKCLVLEGDVLVGVVMYGDIVDGNWFFGLIKDKIDVFEMCEILIFGLVY